MPIEKILLTDFTVNFFILLCVQTGLGHFGRRSLMLASLVLTLDTAAVYIIGGGLSASLPVQIFFCLAASCVLTGSLRIRAVVPTAASVFCAVCVCGGLARLCGNHIVPAVPPALFLFYRILKKRKNIQSRWLIEIVVEKCGVRDSFTALIDTGNRLTDRLSGQPVLIVEASAMPAVSRILPSIPSRSIPFGVLDGGGEIECFKADRIFIRTFEGDLPAPDCRIGVFRGKIPGTIRALAPPEFLSIGRSPNQKK